MNALEPGDIIGYHPVGAPDARQVGIVKHHYGFGRGLRHPEPGDPSNVGVVVTLPDDPRIEERVPYEQIRAHSKPAKA